MNFDDQRTMLGRRYSSSETIELETRYIEQIIEGVENLGGDKSLELHISPMEVECDPSDLALALQRRLKETNTTKTYSATKTTQTTKTTQATYSVEFAYHECNGLLPYLDSYVFTVKRDS